MNTTNFRVDEQLSAEQVQLHALIQHLLIVLSDKEKFIIENRFALDSGKKMTLEEIGRHFGVTRERIRQIEKSALRKLERNAQNTNIKILTEFAKALLEKEGGLAQDEYFKEKLLSILPNISEEDIQDLHLALVLDADIDFHSNTLKYDPHWCSSSVQPSLVKLLSATGVKVLKKTKHVMPLDKICKKVNKQAGTKVSESFLANVLRITKDVKFTEEGVGLFAWRHIHPRTLRDKIQYIFKKEKKPLHFKKISDMIRAIKFDQKRVNIQAVHNELIRNDKFILIGRGIYALSEWGYQEGTVAEVIERILSDGVPRSRDEITKAVLERRHVKTITIYLNLKNKDQFVRVGRDKYTLNSSI